MIGPELGKFIAGIRNDDDAQCVYENREPWRYASRAGIWKEDDRTLTVKCYSPEGITAFTIVFANMLIHFIYKNSILVLFPSYLGFHVPMKKYTVKHKSYN